MADNNVLSCYLAKWLCRCSLNSCGLLDLFFLLLLQQILCRTVFLATFENQLGKAAMLGEGMNPGCRDTAVKIPFGGIS